MLSTEGKMAADSKPRASPRAKALAASNGVSLAVLKGSGPGGRILERDVKAAFLAGAPRGTRSQWKAPSVAVAGATGDVRLNGGRGMSAVLSLAEVAAHAPLTMMSCADAREMQILRREMAESPLEMGLREITISDMVLYAVSRALPHHPELNGRITDGVLEHSDSIDIGFVVDTPRGPMVPVIRNAHQLSLRTLAQEGSILTRRCREGGISPEELAGGTFTVTDFSGSGVEMLTPMLDPSEAATLGVGAVVLKAVQGPDGTVAQNPYIGLSLAFNKLVVDGTTGARFLQTLTGMLARIGLLMAE